ncbi:MAG: hypothetical protein WBP26_02195 [Candidatus Saccharimonadales bacterium]
MSDCPVITVNVKKLENERGDRGDKNAQFVLGVLGDLVEVADSHVGPQPQSKECPFAFMGRLMDLPTDLLEAEARIAFHDAGRTQEFFAIHRVALYRYERVVLEGGGMALRQGWASLVNTMEHPEAYLRSTPAQPQVCVLPRADNGLPNG